MKGPGPLVPVYLIHFDSVLQFSEPSMAFDTYGK
jgi:hypothetical protein